MTAQRANPKSTCPRIFLTNLVGFESSVSFRVWRKLPTSNQLYLMRSTLFRSQRNSSGGQEAKALVDSIKNSGFKLAPTDIPLKMQNPAFEYSAISGAGKSTWGFVIESVLKNAFPDCIIFRVSLNFKGGAGAGSDRGDFQEEVGIPLARALFARGCLETEPGYVKEVFRLEKVIDLLCQLARHGHDPSQKLLLYIHLDEAAMLNENGRDVARWVTCALLEYNMRADRLGWVVPVLSYLSIEVAFPDAMSSSQAPFFEASNP